MVVFWKRMYRKGYAGRLCDAIVQQNPVPLSLLEAIFAPERPLTDGELDVLCLAACGHTDPEIAERLSLSVYSVKKRKRAILARLEARNIAHAIALATQQGLVRVLV